MKENSQRTFRRLLIILLAVMLLTGAMIIFAFYQFYSIASNNIIRRWLNNVQQEAQDVSYYLTMPTDAVAFTGKKLNAMMARNATYEEVFAYLQDETSVYSTMIDENTTGVYCYYKGKYLDGSGWVPPADYDPTSRPWYQQTLRKGGLTVVDPYMNMQTHEMTMAVCQLLDDGESVVCMDVFMDGIQALTEGAAASPEAAYALVLDKSGMIVAHSDINEAGKNYAINTESIEGKMVRELNKDAGNFFELDTGDDVYEIFSEPINQEWKFVLVLSKDKTFSSLTYIYVVTALALIAVFGAILFLFFYINKKHQENIVLSEDMRAAADIYVDLARIDFRSDHLEAIKQQEDGAGFIQNPSDSFTRVSEQICSEMTAEQSKEILKNFLNVENIRERLKEANVLSHEFMDTRDQWIRTRFIVMDRDEKGAPLHALLAFESIDEEKKYQEKLRKLSELDQMTGIRNRGSGEAMIRNLMADGVRGMFCLMDADKFKSINDNYGHDVGDKVIIAIADCLKKTFRDTDVFFRLGGDEFAAYARGVDSEKIGRNIVNRLFYNIDNIHIPELKDRKICLSLGASFYPADRNDSFDALYKRADKGTYRSKEQSGNHATFLFYDTDI